MAAALGYVPEQTSWAKWKLAPLHIGMSTEGSGSTGVLKSSSLKSGNFGFSLLAIFSTWPFSVLLANPRLLQTLTHTLSLTQSLWFLSCYSILSVQSVCAVHQWPNRNKKEKKRKKAAAVTEAAVCAEWTGIHSVVMTCLLPLIHLNWAKPQNWLQLTTVCQRECYSEPSFFFNSTWRQKLMSLIKIQSDKGVIKGR